MSHHGESARQVKVGVLLSGREKFSPYYGGALARWTYEVYRRLAGEVEVRVLGFPTEESDLYNLPHESGSAWRACQWLSHIPLVRRHEDVVWLRSLLSRVNDSDVIHIHNRPQWVHMLRGMDYGNRIILHLQNDHLGHWTPQMLDELAPQVDVVTVCSRSLGNTFTPRSAALAKKTLVVYNGVNTNLFSPREELREPKTVFFVGRLHEEKGVLQLLKAFARVLGSHSDAKLVIGGATGFGIHAENSYVSKLKAQVETIPLKHQGNIQFTGYLHHDNALPEWVQKATLFCAPSLFAEPFGLVNAEAMACGTPVVGSNRGGIPEVLGETGKLVDPEDTSSFADAISDLLSSPAKRADLGRAALDRCRKLFDWDVIAQQWLNLLLQLPVREPR